MEQNTLYQLLEQNITKIFAYCLARVQDRAQAEDLAGDIVVEVLRSAQNLRCDDAFFGYLWTIASRVCRRHMRKQQPASYDDTYMGAVWHSPEKEILHQEEIQLLRRELSLLSDQHRRITVLYYFQKQSCAQIAERLGLSVSMVKYYLSASRKKLKEGISMTREFGEKSYHPATFRLDAWTNGSNKTLFDLFERRLPGNILLAAYEQPMTVSQLSLELGVSTAYLEDEIEILRQNDFLASLPGGKYQTNIIILREENLKAFIKSVKPEIDGAASGFYSQMLEALPKVQPFTGEHMNQNQRMWITATVAFCQAIELADRWLRDKFGEYPLLANGAHGFVFGYDNDYKNHYFNGIHGHCENRTHTAYVCAMNFRAAKDHCNFRLSPWDESLEAITDAVLGTPANADGATIRLMEDGYISEEQGRLKVNFPVFTKDCFDRFGQLMLPLAQEIFSLVQDICAKAVPAFRPHVPALLKSHTAQILAVKYHLDTVGMLADSMVQQGLLQLGDASEKYGIYGVIL